MKRLLASLLSFVLLFSSINVYANSNETNENIDVTLTYTGNTQSWIVPYSGFFYIETWGASGGIDASSQGGYGGYVKTYVYLNKGQTLYICCGGVGQSNTSAANGGYNGGGKAGSLGSSGGGGGATSITTQLRGDGTLKNYENYKDEVLIVAGGGSGGSLYSSGEGGTVLYTGNGIDFPGTIANGASIEKLDSNLTFAIGMDCPSDGGGGGGGWIGGRYGLDTNGNPGGGGASFINTNKNCFPLELVPSTNNGNGYVRISTTDFNSYYNISYELNDGIATNPIIYGMATPSFTLNNPTKVGYDFIGWTGSNGSIPQTNVTIEKGSSGNKTYIANWKPINYTITYNLDGGITNNVISYNIETDTFTLNNPIKEGYTFIGWTGSNGSTKQPNISIEKGSIGNKSYNANYEINQYDVTYIDVVDNINGTQLGKTTKKVDYNSNVRGSDIGNSTNNNVYYNGYSYVSDTSAIVSTNGATVYRIFKLRTIDKTSNLTWNDNNNKNGLRPSKYTLKLLRNGTLFKQVELTSSQTSYTFDNLDKYDSNGNTYTYTFQVDASDRYKMSIDENGNIIENYQNSSFSVIIPKNISLNGNTGKGSYNIKTSGNLYYNDTITIVPNSSFTLKDKNNISNLQGNITQTITSFNKNNLGTTNGNITLNKTKFAGKFNGTFNFNIKFTLKN